MPRSEHTILVEELNAALNALPAEKRDKLRIVTTGILADSPALLKILSDNNMCIVDDQIAHESLFFREDTPLTDDPFMGMAQRIAAIQGCSVLFDPGKNRAKMLAGLARDAGADGVIYIQTKFCDPEEYDYVPVKKVMDGAGIPMLMVEVDQQMSSYEQARSAVETFAEILRQ